MSEQLTKLFAGNPSRPDKDEFKLMVATWTEALQHVVPEYRLGDAFVYARQRRNSSFLLDVSEVCAAWAAIREAQKRMPATGSYEWSRAREVCPECCNTGTKIVVKRDAVLGRDYTCALPCEILK